jgi:hypothetical protein
MGKIILEFDSVEESDDARMAMDGYKWKMVLWDLDQELRTTVKHSRSLLNNDGEATEVEIEVADKVREKIREIMDGYGLNLEP